MTTIAGREEVAAELGLLAAEAEACRACALGSSRTQAVFGVGSPTAEVMFVGEAPGFHEDRQGEPFVGAAGQLLTKLIESKLQLRRSDVYITNTLRCLRYNAMVQLEGGSWERIGRLVRQRYTGRVMSVCEDGSLVPKRVSGWYESPLGGRSVWRLSYRSAKHAGRWPVAIQLTGDHEVLTERGFVAVQELKPTDRVATGQGLTDVAFDVVCGTLLGDGTLGARSSALSFGHSWKQESYALFKSQLLAELHPKATYHSVAAVPGGDRKYRVIHVRTAASRALRTLRQDFYPGTRAVPEWIVDRMNHRMLAIWFMDDGYTRIRPGKKPLSEIATNGFAAGDIDRLLRSLARLGLSAYTLRGRIFFDADASEQLSKRIAPFVPTSMRYKLHPDIAAAVPFDPTLFRSSLPHVMYDEVVADDLSDLPRSDATFFCIDVEDTHNFVTTGGVVHNCRPPANRDPLPDEIEACRPFLTRQLELVKPLVVVTLGNFATKLLLDTRTGITRLRGRRFRFGDASLVPAFHPAAALRGGAAAAGIEQDFELVMTVLEERRARAAAEAAAQPEPEPEQLGLF